MHRVDVIPDRLDSQRPALRRHVALDVRRPDAIEGLADEERSDVIAQIGRHREPVGLAPPFELQALAELSPGLLHRQPLGVGSRRWAVELPHAPQRALGLGLRQPVGTTLGADVADLSAHATAVWPVPSADPGAPDDLEGAGPVRAARLSRGAAHRPSRRPIGTRWNTAFATAPSQAGRSPQPGDRRLRGIAQPRPCSVSCSILI